ncbi:hypothetical protein R3P38DRAFT_821121 [Favolaschia claudopus]|uniref:F-box domain-containing protein n=1 Tax=Favolaschia claudopus TaxID=2862362 RepID=A0AAW0BZ15_9AGAR
MAFSSAHASLLCLPTELQLSVARTQVPILAASGSDLYRHMPLTDSSNPRFVHLPAELLLLIVSFLCHANEKSKSSKYHILPLSVVCRRTRHFCFTPLFSRLSIKHSDRLRLMQEKCTEDPQFSRLIKELDLRYVDCPEEYRGTYHYGPDILPALLPALLSLERLHLPSEQLSFKLLATFNSHPTLLVVETSDPYLNALRGMASETTESMSKIQVVSATLDLVFGFDDPAFHSLMSRSPRLVHLELRDEINITSGPGTVVIPGLETLGIQVCTSIILRMTLRAAKLTIWFPHSAFSRRCKN